MYRLINYFKIIEIEAVRRSFQKVYCTPVGYAQRMPGWTLDKCTLYSRSGQVGRFFPGGGRPNGGLFPKPNGFTHF